MPVLDGIFVLFCLLKSNRASSPSCLNYLTRIYACSAATLTLLFSELLASFPPWLKFHNLAKWRVSLRTSYGHGLDVNISTPTRGWALLPERVHAHYKKKNFLFSPMLLLLLANVVSRATQLCSTSISCISTFAVIIHSNSISPGFTSNPVGF